MITIYTGTPGAGKTSHALCAVRDCAWSGKRVLTNFPCNAPKWPRRSGFSLDFVEWDALTPSLVCEWLEGVTGEGRALLVIDEAQLVFNSRDWNAAGRREWIAFFTQHRKLGCDVILIAQDSNMLDKQIRALCEVERRHRRLSSFGLIGWALSLGGQLMAYSDYHPATRFHLGGGLWWLSPQVRRMYDTCHLMAGSLGASSPSRHATPERGAAARVGA